MNTDDPTVKSNTADRRKVLKILGLAAATGGVAAASRGAAAEMAEHAQKTGSIYRETEHVKTYYELARF